MTLTPLIQVLKKMNVFASLVLLFAGFIPTLAYAQYGADIRFPSSVIEGQVIVIEMLEDSCNGILFTSELYDVVVSGPTITASVDGIENGLGSCPPGGAHGWRSFHFGPLPAGNYDLAIQLRPFAGGNQDPIGPPLPYASTSFVVATVQALAEPYSVPSQTLWGLIALCCLSLWLGALQLHRD